MNQKAELEQKAREQNMFLKCEAKNWLLDQHNAETR
jgi:hypothetical protein